MLIKAKYFIQILFILGCSGQKLNKNKLLIIEAAQKEWERVLKDDFSENAPFKISRKDSFWIVKGSLSCGKVGGVPVAIIDITDLKVIEVYHTK